MHKLELVGLTKTFKKKTAVLDVSVTLEYGVYGLLGQNGAGKTTLMRMICGILEPTRGHILCDGIPIRRLGGDYRVLLGYLPQDFGYYKDFTARRFLSYMAALKALPEQAAKDRIDELLELTGLADERDNKLKTFSGGMIRRVGIAQALLNDPRILVLDEPTSGLDPGERVRFRNIISSLGKDRLILLSTHIVSDIEYIADRILLMKDGGLIHTEDEHSLLEQAEGRVWRCLVPEEKAPELDRQYIVSNLRRQGAEVELRIVSGIRPTPDAEPVDATLEDACLYLLNSGPQSQKTISDRNRRKNA